MKAAAFTIVLLSSAVAHADDGEPRATRGFGAQVADAATELGQEIDAHLGLISAGTLRLEVDGASRRVHVSFRVDGEDNGIAIRSDVHVRGGAAKVYAQIDLRVIGHHIHIDVPEVDLVPRSYDGERYVEVRVPIWTRSF